MTSQSTCFTFWINQERWWHKNVDLHQLNRRNHTTVQCTGRRYEVNAMPGTSVAEARTNIFFFHICNMIVIGHFSVIYENKISWCCYNKRSARYMHSFSLNLLADKNIINIPNIQCNTRCPLCDTLLCCRYKWDILNTPKIEKWKNTAATYFVIIPVYTAATAIIYLIIIFKQALKMITDLVYYAVNFQQYSYWWGWHLQQKHAVWIKTVIKYANRYLSWSSVMRTNGLVRVRLELQSHTSCPALKPAARYIIWKINYGDIFRMCFKLNERTSKIITPAYISAHLVSFRNSTCLYSENLYYNYKEL